MSDRELDPDKAPPADLPRHARERLAEMKKKHFFDTESSGGRAALSGALPLMTPRGALPLDPAGETPDPARSGRHE